MNRLIIYCYTFPNDKKYIGQTCKKSIEERYDYGNGYNGMLVDKAIKKYGWNNIKKEILFIASNIEEANEVERYYISYYNSLAKNGSGYNVSDGGSNGNNFSGFTQEEMDEYKLKQRNAQLGEKSHRYGKSHSKETIEKMKIKASKNNPFKGKKHTQETKNKWKRSKSDNGNSKSVVVLDGEEEKVFYTILEASEYMEMSYSTMRNYLRKNKFS